MPFYIMFAAISWRSALAVEGCIMAFCRVYHGDQP